MPKISTVPALLVATVAFAAASVAAAQSLTPSVVFSVHDEPVDGQGDSFNGSPFEGLIRTTVVIAPDQKVVKIFPKVRVKGHVAKVLETLDAHRAG